ncbi:hypothetical protein FQN50_002733 [Emmonsiellopsis sp. PD_5]|nr:hypothetical protein FQN50_002733 [Emmonsiellopsis sp. PD_5]
MAMEDHDTTRERDDETRPLLAAEPSPSQTRPRRFREKPVVLVFLCLLLIFCIDFGSYMSLAPQTRIYESIACRNYYESHDPGWNQSVAEIPEEQCKIAPVQGEVAFVQGMQGSFDAIPSIFLSVAYGRLADNPKYGRKLVILLALVGLLLNQYTILTVTWFSRIFPLRAVWLGSAFTVIGAGASMGGAMVITMISDVVEAKNRSTAFFQVALSVVVAQFVAPPISSWMMSKTDPWVPLLLGTLISSISALLIFLLPETVHLRDTKDEEEPSSASETPSDEASEETTPTYPSRYSKFQPRNLLHNLHTSIKPIVPNLTTALLLSTFLITNIGRKEIDLLLLYVSTRYHTSVSNAAFTLSVFAGVNIFLLLIVLPTISRYLTVKRNLPSNLKDLAISRFSITVLTLGSVCMALAPTLATMTAGLVVYTLGGGFNAVNMSLVSTLVEPRHIARLYSVISMLSMVGAFVGGPLLAALFGLGMKMGEGWVGLPFLGAALLYGVIWVPVWFIRLPRGNGDDDGNVDGGDPEGTASSPLRYTDE